MIGGALLYVLRYLSVTMCQWACRKLLMGGGWPVFSLGTKQQWRQDGIARVRVTQSLLQCRWAGGVQSPTLL